MKKLIYLLLLIIASSSVFGQSWNKITGKTEITDSVKFTKYRNNPTNDSALVIDYVTKKLINKKFSTTGGSGIDSLAYHVGDMYALPLGKGFVLADLLGHEDTVQFNFSPSVDSMWRVSDSIAFSIAGRLRSIFAPVVGAGWSLTGNAGTNPSSNFIGTTDVQPLIFKTNGNEVGRFAPNGDLLLGFGQIVSGSGGRNLLSGTSNSITNSFGSAIFGAGNSVIGNNSAAIGSNNYVTSGNSDPSFAIGRNNSPSYSSIAIGEGNQVSGMNSMAFGNGLFAKSQEGIAFGSYNNNSNTPNPSSPIGTDRLIEFGNGTGSGSRSNAMTILRNGNIGINVLVPTQKLDILGKIKIVDGTEGAGKVFTDVVGDGVGSWITPTSSGGATYLAGSGLVLQGTTFKIQDTLNGSATKLIWMPSKKAFRAGSVTGNSWDVDSIATNSTAFGLNTRATGDYSFASGNNTFSRGFATTSIGYNTIAISAAAASFVGGSAAIVRGNVAFSFGQQTEANGFYSNATGFITKANGNSSTSMGSLTQANGDFSFAQGIETMSKSYGGFAIGIYNDTTNAASGSSINGLNRIFQIGNGTASFVRSNALTVQQDGRFGFGLLVPSALIHLNQGLATAGFAPLKFTSGTPTTTPEIGALHFNDGLLILDSSNSKRDTIATRDWVMNNSSNSGGSSTTFVKESFISTLDQTAFTTAGTLPSDEDQIFVFWNGVEIDFTHVGNTITTVPIPLGDLIRIRWVSSGATATKESFVATLNQTAFTTAATLPIDATKIFVFWNGVEIEFTHSGNTVTTVPIPLGDIIRIRWIN